MVDALQPQEETGVVDAESEEQVLARVISRSIRTALRDQVRRHHVAAYNAEQLEAGIWASEQFEANR